MWWPITLVPSNDISWSFFNKCNGYLALILFSLSFNVIVAGTISMSAHSYLWTLMNTFANIEFDRIDAIEFEKNNCLLLHMAKFTDWYDIRDFFFVKDLLFLIYNNFSKCTETIHKFGRKFEIWFTLICNLVNRSTQFHFYFRINRNKMRMCTIKMSFWQFGSNFCCNICS